MSDHLVIDENPDMTPETIVEVTSKAITPVVVGPEQKLTPVEEEIAEKIVVEWNSLVTTVQNTTIALCLMIKDMTKDFPQESIKKILTRVQSHPNIKRFVSIDRIWQGLRLVNRKPKLIEFDKMQPEQKAEIPYKEKPYLKKDGEIFWEFYFELEKAPLKPIEREMLEIEGKNGLWSYRELKKQIQLRKDELESSPGEIMERKREKELLIRTCAGILRGMTVEKLRDAKILLEKLKVQNLGGGKNA